MCSSHLFYHNCLFLHTEWRVWLKTSLQICWFLSANTYLSLISLDPSGPVTRTCSGWCPSRQRTWSTCLTICCLASASAMSETSTDYSNAWFPSFTQKSMSHFYWWLYKASLVQFKDAWWCPDTLACSASFWSSFSSLGINFVWTFPNIPW